MRGMLKVMDMTPRHSFCLQDLWIDICIISGKANGFKNDL